MNETEADNLWLHLLAARRYHVQQVGHFLLPDEPCQDPGCVYERWQETPLWICQVRSPGKRTPR